MPMVLGVAEALAGEAGVIADEVCASHQQVQDKAHKLHADGDEEKDDGVLPLVLDQQLGEDATQGDDDPCGA